MKIFKLNDILFYNNIELTITFAQAILDYIRHSPQYADSECCTVKHWHCGGGFMFERAKADERNQCQCPLLARP